METQITTQNQNKTLGELMHSPAVIGKLNDVWNSPQMANSFISSVISVANGNPQLRNADPMSIIGAAMVAATMQLQVVPTLGQCYIIPYGSKAQFQCGYLGILQLCQRSGQFKKSSPLLFMKESMCQATSLMRITCLTRARKSPTR